MIGKKRLNRVTGTVTVPSTRERVRARSEKEKGARVSAVTALRRVRPGPSFSSAPLE